MTDQSVEENLTLPTTSSASIPSDQDMNPLANEAMPLPDTEVIIPSVQHEIQLKQASFFTLAFMLILTIGF